MRQQVPVSPLSTELPSQYSAVWCVMHCTGVTYAMYFYVLCGLGAAVVCSVFSLSGSAHIFLC